MPSASDKPVILQVLPSLVTGGVERSAIEIAQAVAEADGVALVTSAGGPLVKAVERAGGRHIALPLDRKTPFAIWRNAARLAALIRAENVSLVHARSRAPAWSAWLAARRTGVHFVTTYHGVYNEELPFKRQYNAVMARGEIVIAASRYVAELVVARHRLYPTRVRVIPRGVDPAVFDPAIVVPDRLARLAAAWRLPDGVPTVVLPGRLTSWKGQSVLLAAVARMTRRDVCCVLVGSDQGRHRYSAQLVRQARQLGIAERVRLVGNCDDMPAAFMLSDVVVHASTRPEAFGRVVIEAQAMGRPVVAADLGGPVETVREDQTGWRVPAGDPGALAAAIERALALSETERMALGQRARAAVQRSYTVRAMQEATLDVYEELLSAEGC
ncbi:MAG TPA: glycosyltransferase family 4 protein [Acetobacteraceae bacterium]|nr:glycosyltransferase family 4 protein [Acetobacteraceae bacterium]